MVDVSSLPLVANEKTWNSLSPDELEMYAQRIFDTYRASGFPYYRYTDDEKRQEFAKLLDYDYSKVIVGDTIRQTMHGLGLAWSYFPHSWDVPCGSYPTPMGVFNDDTLFKVAISQRLKYGSYMSDSGMRKALRTYNHVQSVSNFRPSAAAAIYQYAAKAMNKEWISTWDMSGGFGGRLLGAYASNVVKLYSATDPSYPVYNGLITMSEDIYRFTQSRMSSHVSIKGSETDDLPFGEVDLAFTSPPYFNTERYSNDEAQSYLKFPTYPDWLTGFLGRTMDNVNLHLKSDGMFIINVAKVKTAPTLIDDTLRLAQSKGFKLVTTLKLALSNRTQDFKYEPVFVFKR